MRIVLHIGPEVCTSERLQAVMEHKRGQMRARGVLFARSTGARNHTRLFMAVTDPGALDTLRFYRGIITADRQAGLAAEVQSQLQAEVAQADGVSTLVLSAHQLGSVTSRTALIRLRDLLAPLSQDIHIVAHVDAPARMLVRRYALQVRDGRARSLRLELSAAAQDSYWEAAVASCPPPDPRAGLFPEIQGAVPYLDLIRMQAEWEAVFGAGALAFRSPDRDAVFGPDATDDLRAALGIEGQIGKAEAAEPPKAPAAAWLTRCRRFNAVALRLLQKQPDLMLPRPLWRRLMTEFRIGGDPLDPGSLEPLSRRFAPDVTALCAAHPGLSAAQMAAPPATGPWREAEPERGFRETHYLAAFLPRIRRAETDDMERHLATLASAGADADAEAETPLPRQIVMPGTPDALLSPGARSALPEAAKQAFMKLQKGPFRPHNRLGAVTEDALAAAYTPAPARTLADGRTGAVIIGCMKNEAPYILEWVAYHRCIGIDSFVIYTNDCDDGTVEILERLQEMGLVHHRDNAQWTGNSPQQFALDAALNEPEVRSADWIAHIDVDEFINIRCGNGTLDDLFAQTGDATNIAMTWRLFGHNGIARLRDAPVIDQFDMAAPKYCPKPHTVWGFKTLFRNIGAYHKLSCHRPNKLAEGYEDKVRWVNGSGQDMTEDVLKNGWRNSKKTIGYDLVQLNHYALRSAESFLIKRQRGRALHVDRSIGLNYWVRMDWSVHRDITIKRNLPRLRSEMARLMADDQLAYWHRTGLDWHRARAQELRAQPEFEELFAQAISLSLTETERVAFALALDMES